MPTTPGSETSLFAFVRRGETPSEFLELLPALERSSGPMCIRPDAAEAVDVTAVLQAFAREAAAPAANVWSPEPIATFLRTGDVALAATVDKVGADFARPLKRPSLTKSLPSRAASVVSWAGRAHRPDLAEQVPFSVYGCLESAANFGGFAVALTDFKAGNHRKVSSYWSDGLEASVRDRTRSQLVVDLIQRLLASG